jgi:hypothetical protein
MILNNTPQNEAVLSNVGQIGEFKIRNSAKAFNILSSGLYANKIRAVIRELSCNAVDSHAAAGNMDTPFTVHLPTTLEPWFSVRDFGTGLNHDQVTNIYTTYFESTKTNSNDFIGALGLGSKSPFSYTDNFTVTAIQDGVERIYSAFINDEGVPSIVKMGEESTVNENGVEIKFSVNERYDFSKFISEAQVVYQYFALKPTVIGVTHFEFSEVQYEFKDIIPGVHSRATDFSRTSSVAVMGNIAYPINIPASNTELGNLRSLLDCNLVMYFGIGELDFQASREGLSYIPQTIESIKRKLETVNGQLTVRLAEEANKIANKWERSIFLYSKARTDLWKNSVLQYVKDTAFELVELSNTGYSTSRYRFELICSDLASKFNVKLRGFNIHRGSTTCSMIKTDHKNFGLLDNDGYSVRQEYIDLPVDVSVSLVINDTKLGVTERAKYHWRNKTSNNKYSENVFVVEVADKTKPIKVKEFLESIGNPPESNIILASTLDTKDRVSSGKALGKNISLLRMEERGGPRHHSSSNQLVWREAPNLGELDDTQTYYYIPLSGFVPEFTTRSSLSAQEVVRLLNASDVPELNIHVYGVRKTNIETVKGLPNWKNLEEYLLSLMDKLQDVERVASSLNSIDKNAVSMFDFSVISKQIDAKSPMAILMEKFNNLPRCGNWRTIHQLVEMFVKERKVYTTDLAKEFNDEFTKMNERYPLIAVMDTYRASSDDVSNYINLVDQVKGI